MEASPWGIIHKYVKEDTEKKKIALKHKDHLWCVQHSIHAFVEKCLDSYVYLREREVKGNQEHMGNISENEIS